jgi:cadmium resistance protein CadD (predicted permease)
MVSLLPYVIGAAMVGILHMSAPDHWVTICMLGKSAKWTRTRLFGTSLAAAIGHVVLSIVLGLGVVAVGLVFSHLISFYLDTGIAIIMITVGLIIGIRSLVKKNEHHHKHDHDEDNKKNNDKLNRGVGYFAVLGAALSPDLSITPIYLSAIKAGFYFAIELSVVFAAASILTLLLLVQLGTAGLAKTFEKIPEKYNDSMVGFVIAAIGVYILVAR